MDFQLAELSPCLGSGLDGVDIGAFGVGCTTTDVIGTEIENLPDAPVLSQNYPNPFNPSTVIEYTLPEKADVNVTIYNVLGQAVVTLIDEARPAGTHQIVWNGTTMNGKYVASGVYLYRLQVGGKVLTRSMVLVR